MLHDRWSIEDRIVNAALMGIRETRESARKAGEILDADFAEGLLAGCIDVAKAFDLSELADRLDRLFDTYSAWVKRRTLGLWY